MRSKIGWIVATILVVVLLAVMPFFLRAGGFGWYGRMMGVRGMMDFHPGFFFPFGFVWMGVMMLAPVAVLVLLVMGGVALVNNLTGAGKPAAPQANLSGRTCPNCAKPAQADWKNCPYCGTALE